ncbi:hypothetical protein V8324_22160, partial [Roseovarius sp. D22-M7]
MRPWCFDALRGRSREGHALAGSRIVAAAMLKTIFALESKADADAQWDTVADALREKQDKRGTFMDASRIGCCIWTPPDCNGLVG